MFHYINYFIIIKIDKNSTKTITEILKLKKGLFTKKKKRGFIILGDDINCETLDRVIKMFGKLLLKEQKICCPFPDLFYYVKTRGRFFIKNEKHIICNSE